MHERRSFDWLAACPGWVKNDPRTDAPPGVNLRARRLAYLSIYVSDLDNSRRFYCDLLGLPILRQEAWGAVIQAGEVELFLHPQDHVAEPDQRLELTFDIDDADVAVAELRAVGVPIVEEVADRDWGDRDGAVEDPDGNVVFLRSRPPRSGASPTHTNP